MHTLVINSGSSSIKFSVFRSDDSSPTGLAPAPVCEGRLTEIGSRETTLSVSGLWSSGASGEQEQVKAETAAQAIDVVLALLSRPSVPAIDAVGYRVVHPGPHLKEHQRITPEVLQLLEEAKEFAPLHDPEAIKLIRCTMQRFPEAVHYACFDTVFHQTMPEEANTYPLPAAYRESGVRRYGFHGLSCESVVMQMKAAGALQRRMVIAHLGSGCSLTALVDGRSVDTTMGLTPTGGVLMGTRSGDLDPGLVLYLLRKQVGDREQALDAVETLLNHGSGVSALSGLENDMQKVRSAAASGNEQARLALKVFIRSIAKAIGGFCWLLGGLDAIVFTGGIGEHDAATRSEVLEGLTELGVELAGSELATLPGGLQRISASTSRTEVLVVPAKEDLTIAIHVERMAHGINAHGYMKHPVLLKEHR
jgi:acetate kinase